jgi:hypothetical protein
LLLNSVYQVTVKFKSSGRLRKLVGAVTTWHPTSSHGREVASVPKPVFFRLPPPVSMQKMKRTR